MPFNVPSLSDLENEEEFKNHYVSSTSNWVVPNVIMVGQSPARATSVANTMEYLIVDRGVTTFVCLQSEVLPQTKNGIDLGGIKDGNEADILPSYADAACNVKGVSEVPKFVYFGIRDYDIAESLEGLDILIENLLMRINDEEVLYIHCKGGFGRSGLVAACILGRLYPSISFNEILQRIHQYCTMRWKGEKKCVPHNVKSPETNEQVEQVKQYLRLVKNKNRKM